MKPAPPESFGAHLKALREAAGFTQDELATIAGLSVHAVSALERGERRRPQFETVRSLSTALDLPEHARNALLASARLAGTSKTPGIGGPSLPLPLTNLVGREDDLATLRQWLTEPAVRLITLLGPGGVGKTRLALELAHATADDNFARVVFVSLAAVRDPAFVASSIAEAFGVGDAASLDLPRRARAVCGAHPVLLVLDNFEQVLTAASLVADLIASVPSLRIVATSRAPLHVRGEREFVVSTLALAPASDDMPVDVLGQCPAVRLFVDRIRDVQPEFEINAANAPTVAMICRRLDALPLALELAAPWIKVLTAGGLLDKLGRDGLLTTAGPRDLPERQQTMNATVAWSYELLSPTEQYAFRRFGALPGLFPVDAAAEVLTGHEVASGTDDALIAIAGLIDKSLLQRSETSVVATCPLYYMLETVRTYAANELITANERGAAMEGLVRYCTAEAALAGQGLVGPAQVVWLDRVREDLDSYRAALAWLIADRRGDEATQIAWPLLFFWLIRGHATEGLRWFEQILRLPTLAPSSEARARLGAAAMMHTRGEFTKARVHLTQTLTLARDSGDAEVIPLAAWMFGHVEYADGNLTASEEWFSQSRDTSANVSIPWIPGSALSGLAWVALANGDQQRADRLVTEATSTFRDAGPWFLALGLYVRVLLTLQRGDADDVIALMRQSLIRVSQTQDKFGVVYGMIPLAAAAALKGDHAWVARILGARDAITERAGSALSDPLMRELGERIERDARERLGPGAWARSHAEGSRSSVESMLTDIDRAIGVPSSAEQAVS
jgi:predicted ATPase/DNA-binding XRE family transcriptional regulator